MTTGFQQQLAEKEQKIVAYLHGLGVHVEEIQNKQLLLQTFVHKSFAADYKDTRNHNERLEFLWDGILGAIINKLLFINHPSMPESELTLYKIALVREEILAEVARDIALDTVVFISRGEERSQWRKKDSILSDTLEAVIGFLYIELGIEETEKFITKYIYSKIPDIKKHPVKSYKTMIQEHIQKQYKIIPEYKESEVETDSKGNVLLYRSDMYIGEQKKSEWFGTNKKKAQEEAAKNYYSEIGGQE